MGAKYFRVIQKGLILALCALMAACASQVEEALPTGTNTAAPVPTATSTRLPTLTATPLPTPTFTPIVFPTTAPPSVVMPFSGIYVPGNEKSKLIMFDGPRGTVEEIVLLDEGRINWLSEAISPDRQWVVFTTGSIENGDIALQMLNLENRSIIKISDLLSDHFPEDLSEIAGQLVYIDPEETESWDYTKAVLHSLGNCLGDYAWSHDGRYLAFIGQMDGPSTDVYLYERATGDVRGISTEIHLNGDLHWSPDSEKIVFSSIKPTKNMMELTSLFFVDIVDQVVSIELSGYVFHGWLSDDEALLIWSGDGVPSILTIFDIESGQPRSIWFNAWPEFKFSYEDHSILLPGTLERKVEGGEDDWGVYLVDSSGNWEKVMEIETLVGITAWSTNVSDCLIHYLGTTYLYSRENGLRELFSEDDLNYNMSVISPDQRWLLLAGPEYGWVYDSNAQAVLEFSHRRKFNFIGWGPNSDGFFYWEDGWLYYMALPSGEVLTLEACEWEGCWIYDGVIWLGD